jgi:hypothetical protein
LLRWLSTKVRKKDRISVDSVLESSADRRAPYEVGGESMPDSFGKRQRNAQKARKFAAREERRAARKKEREDRAAGVFQERAPDESRDEEVDGALEGEPEPSGPGSGDQTESNDST